MSHGLAYETPRPAVVTIPAELRRVVAGAIYEAAADIAKRIGKLPPGRARQREDLIREERALRELAEEITP